MGVNQPGRGAVLTPLDCLQVLGAANAVGFPDGQPPMPAQPAAAFRLFLSMKLENRGALTAVLGAQIGIQVGIVPVGNHQHPFHGTILLLNRGPNGLTDNRRHPTGGSRHGNHPDSLHATGRYGPGLLRRSEPANLHLNRNTAHGWDLPHCRKRCTFAAPS